jgi:ABC-type Zn uptake system ZnuABC Zn-binding protein ZnuA
MYQIQKGLIIQKIDKETVIFDAEESVLYTLNETAAEIFKMIKKGPKEEQIFEKMLKRYKVKKERVEKDVKEIVGELEKRKIVVFKNKVVLFLIHEFKEKLIDYFF